MKTTVRILWGAIVAMALIFPTTEIYAAQSSAPQYNGYRGGTNKPEQPEKPDKPGKPDKPSGNRPNGGRPGGNPGGITNRPNHGHKPNGGKPGSNPGGISNRPNHGHHPGGKPDIAPPHHPGHGHPTFSPAPPLYRPHRPCWKPVPRPHRPPTFVPYHSAPVLNTFIGLSFGLSFSNSIHLLWSNGYDIDGYGETEI